MAWFQSLPLLVAQATEPVLVETTSGLAPWFKLGVTIAIIAGSFGLGVLIAQALRLPEFAFRIGLVLFTAIASAAVCYFGWPPKLGIDLSGGVVLVYEAESGDLHAGKLQELATSVERRLNDGRDEKLSVRVSGDKLDVVGPPGADIALIENQIATLRGNGIMLASAGRRTNDKEIVLTYEPDQSFKSVDMEKLVAAVNKRINPSGVKEVTVRAYGPEQIEVIVPEVEQNDVKLIKEMISTSGALEFRILANRHKSDHKSVISRAEASPAREVVDMRADGTREVAGKWVEAKRDVGFDSNSVMRNKPNGKGAEVLVINDPYNVTGQYLRRASSDIDQTGRDCIAFSFNSEGAQLFGALTGENLPDQATGMEQRLGIVLDNELISAPSLKSQIRDQGQITGGFDKSYVDMVVGVLNAGSLPTALQKQPISEQRISAQLGNDTIRDGSRAMLIATAGVVFFMLMYYRFAGAVADMAVILNMVIAVALMIMINAAFTLPGLAGFVLTVGMAVDANVLIYERMREEQQRGASLRMAIRNGYARAMSTIIDSNVTTIATGVVLFAIGTDQIKGFAITLILGLMVSLFTAVYVSRIIFDIAEKKRWLTRLNMMQWFKKTNFDFVSYCKPAVIASLIVIGIGMAGVFVRGKNLLDIDFTGGSSVQVQFRKGEPQDIALVREKMASLPDVAVSSVGTDNLEFKIDTSEKQIDVVREKVKEAFGDKLSTYSMNFGDLKPYAPAAEKPATEAGVTEPAQPAEKAPAEEPAAKIEPAAEPAATEEKTEPASTPETSPETTPDAKSAEPASETSTPTEKTEPPADQPDPNKSASVGAGLGRPYELALATLAVSQGAADEPTKTEEPISDSKSETSSETETTPAPAAEATKPTEETKPAAAAEDPVAEPSADTSDTPAAEKYAANTTGASAELSFPELISYGTLHDRIADELTAEKLAGTYFELHNPDYSSGSSQRYEKWTLDILLPAEQTKTLLDTMQAKLKGEPVFPSANEIGGKVAGNTKLAAVYALIASLVMIVIYVWIRFQNALFGIAAVIALIHDVLVALGFLALSYWLANIPGMAALQVDPFKISLAVVAALLTIVGFSINDTIVIFDRIREIRGKSPELTGPMINQAVNETLSRTFITSGTVLIATAILYFFGGAGIHPFAFAMLVGVISGTYSTVYIAAPLLLWMKPPTANAPAARNAANEPARSR